MFDNFISKQFLNYFINIKDLEDFKISYALLKHLEETKNSFLFGFVFQNNSKPFFYKVINIEEYKKWLDKQKSYHTIRNNSNTRQLKAIAGLSTHEVKTQYNFLLFKTLNKELEVISFDKNNILNNKIHNFNETLLIVENIDLFYEISELQEFFKDIDFSTTDIIYGMGKNATDSKFKNLYLKYNNILILSDIDLGGFEIYRSIKTLVLNNNTSVDFVYPNIDYNFYLQRSNHIHKFQNIPKYIEDFESLLDSNDIKILKLLHKYEVGLEQELYLNFKEN